MNQGSRPIRRIKFTISTSIDVCAGIQRCKNPLAFANHVLRSILELRNNF
jgi:hypothetical protein